MKIAVIGGAGVRTVIFINGLLKRYKKLHIDEVVLYDIQEEKQRIIERLCCHVVERKQEDMKARFEDGILHLEFPKTSQKQVEETHRILIE